MIKHDQPGFLDPPFNPPAPVEKMDPKEKYKKEIEEMKMMGFADETKVIQYLDEESGNIERAIDKMISGGMIEEEEME